MVRFISLLAAAALAACGSSGTPQVQKPATPIAGGLAQGLIAYAADGGVGVLDPATGKSMIVAPLAPGAFRVMGPVWGTSPGVPYPVIYFTIHDDRTPERRTTAGVVPYDWLFRVDPFAGTIAPVAASQDSQSEGPIGLFANTHYLAMSYGCCASYEVDSLDLTKAAAPISALSRPPNQAAFFTEGIVSGESSLIAVRAAGTGAWYWLNADGGTVHPFPLKLGPEDGPIAVSADGTMVAVALPSQGAVIEPINSGLPIASPSPNALPSALASSSPAKPSPSPSAATKGPKKVNSQLDHPDGLTWSPDGSQLAVAARGEIELYKVDAPDGPPAKTYLSHTNVLGVSWSGPMTDRTLAGVKANPGPQATVDALLNATRLPAQADTAANRPFTLVYVWQFDSSKSSAVEAITDATAAVLAKYPPLSAGVVFHHWAPSGTWALLGGCYRYRVVITGSIPPVASTIGLTGNTPCAAGPSPS